MWISGLIICFGWVFSLCLHEFAHALVAYWGGDTTVKEKGYLTFNPLKYTQPGLSIILPLVFILVGGMGLPGGAVYINSKLIRNRIWDSLVSAAGPLSNLLFASFLILPFWLLDYSAIDVVDVLENSRRDAIFASLGYLIYIEVFAVLFNLLPIPGLDGYGIIRPWLPEEVNKQFSKYGNYSYLFIFGLFLFVPKFGAFFFQIIGIVCNWVGVDDAVLQMGRYLFHQPVNQLITIIIILILGYSLQFNEHTWYEKGNKLARQKKDEEAIAAYDKAISIKPDYADAWLRKADSYFRLKSYDRAIEAYQRTIELNPQEYDAWLFLGHTYFGLEKYHQAIEAYQRTVELNPQEYDAWKFLAHASSSIGNYQQAVEAYQQAIELDSAENKAQIYLYLAYSLSDLNRLEEAIATIDKAIEIEPQNNRLWLYKVSYLYELKKYQAIINLGKFIPNIEVENIKLYYYLCLALIKTDRYSEAQKIFDRMTTLKPDNILALLGRAEIYYQKQDYLKASEFYQQVIEIEPNNNTAWYNLACCYSLQQKSSQAIVALQKAIAIEPEKTIELIKGDRDFACLQNLPAFQNLIKER